MTDALKLMEYLEAEGHEIDLEGGNLRVAKGKHLPSDVINLIVEHKAELIEMLDRDEKARKAGFIIGLTGELYTKTLGRNSAVYIEKIGDKWEAWRETHIQGRSQSVNYKVIAAAKEFEHVLVKAEGYFDYIEKQRNKGK